MMCAALCDSRITDVLLFEKNEKLGKKLFITGKGRGNLTNTADVEQMLQNIPRNPRFLYSALYGFDSTRTVAYFNSLGLKTKTERGGRVFPESDHAYEITDALKTAMAKNGVKIRLNTPVKEILAENEKVTGIRTADGRKYSCDSVVVATGGLSYPSTGSTGDGYAFARILGHRVKGTYPSLVSFKADRKICTPLAGVSLKNIAVSIRDKKAKELFSSFGELLFTHEGISGPLILTASAMIREDTDLKGLDLYIDLKPALDEKKLDERLIREFKDNSNKRFKNSISSLFVHRMEPLMLKLSGIDPEKTCNSITKEERLSFGALIKNLKVPLTGRGGFEEAVITRGGVDVRQIDPSSMESKLIKGLYFIGEVLDVDALTGGFNLQIAWSTAAQAARAVSEGV